MSIYASRMLSGETPEGRLKIRSETKAGTSFAGGCPGAKPDCVIGLGPETMRGQCGLAALGEATRLRLVAERDRWREIAAWAIAAGVLGWLLFFTRWP